MITAQVRQALADGLADELAGVAVAVLPYGVTGPFQPPCVVLGQPDTEFGDFLCVDKNTLGLAVVVRDHPQGPAATQQELEGLWPQVAAAVKRLLQADNTLGGLVVDARLMSAEFGDLVVQGQPFPAQQLTLEIYTT